MIERILLPLDAEGHSQQQIRYGNAIASSMGAELCLLHVAAPSRRGHRPGWLAMRQLQVADRLLPAHTVLSSSVGETIASYAHSIDADLVLMPTRGRGLLGQILYGSTTMDVLRIATRPVWVAKPKAVLSEKPVRCKRILCGVALGAEGESVVRYAARLAESCAGELLIVHAISEISEAMLMVYGLDDSREIELLPRSARRRISAMAASLDVPYRVEVKIGDVAGIVRRFAKQWNADLVVVGRGRTTDRWQFGANVGDIIARSPCPVITVSGGASVIRRSAEKAGRLTTFPEALRGGACIRDVPREIAV